MNTVWFYTQNSIDIIRYGNTVYRVIFAKCNFHPFALAKNFAPSRIHPDTVVCLTLILINTVI